MDPIAVESIVQGQIMAEITLIQFQLFQKVVVVMNGMYKDGE
jgi:hypothetical protein